MPYWMIAPRSPYTANTESKYHRDGCQYLRRREIPVLKGLLQSFGGGPELIDSPPPEEG